MSSNQGPGTTPLQYTVYVPPSNPGLATLHELDVGIATLSGAGSTGPTGPQGMNPSTTNRLFYAAYTGGYNLANNTATTIAVPASTITNWIMTGSLTVVTASTGAYFYNPGTATQKLWSVNSWMNIAAAGQVQLLLHYTGAPGNLLNNSIPANAAMLTSAASNSGLTWSTNVLMNPGDGLYLQAYQDIGSTEQAAIYFAISEV